MNIRPFNHSEKDYDAIIAINNAAIPDNLASLIDWKARDEGYPQKLLRDRLIAEDDNGAIVGYSFYSEPEWSYQPGKYLVLVTILPEQQRKGIGSALYDATMAILMPKSPKIITSSGRESLPDGVRFLEKRDFQQIMREPITQLDLTTFDRSAFAHYIERLSDIHIDVYRGDELAERDPNFWRKFYDLSWEIEQDIPSPSPPTKPEFEHFVESESDPRRGFRLDGFYFGVDKTVGHDEIGGYVGISTLKLDQADPTKLHISITGVSRSHRRRGIGTALKIKAMEFADRVGATFIDTKNEENNPMYQLNIEMGFKEVTAELTFEKHL